jgi:FkbM family methyltransferase
MPFISYAQNYEDVILWRALRDLERGFYVDVGATDPEELSVTHAFYERGWSGINVEPLDEYFNKLMLARPRDTNLKVAAGREVGQRTLHVVDGTGLSTLDPKIAAQHRAAGRQPHEIAVPTVTLEKILEDYAPPTIHFLKIDVEGAEAEVLASLNLNRARPWIIVVEATKPFSMVSSRDEWEHLVTNYGYHFAYFDGLNCFYVADEVRELKEQLAVPPNVFDDFVRTPERADTPNAKYLRASLEAEKKYSAYLHEVLEAQRTQIAQLHHVLVAEQAQVGNLTTALQVQQAQVAKLEVQLALPSVDRALGRTARRLHEIGDRLTGGGIRALATRTRDMIIPSRRLANDLDRVAAEPDAPTAPPTVGDVSPLGAAGGLQPLDDPVVAALPALARTTYFKLETALSKGGESHQVP